LVFQREQTNRVQLPRSFRCSVRNHFDFIGRQVKCCNDVGSYGYRDSDVVVSGAGSTL
jgi:hypothetical protein